MNSVRTTTLLIASIALAGCGGTDDESEPNRGPSIAEDLGLTQYAGKIDPRVGETDGDVTSYSFDPDQGPRCMRGDEYHAGVRDTGADDLVIFMQGGGACWSSFCLAVTKATTGVPAVDILNPELASNPVADWNVVYLPYCDGSFFSGDAEIDDDLNGKGTRYHRGLANMTGALEVAKSRFAKPKRILLAGSSGGAYGLLIGTPLVRHYYPDAELIVMADSGIGLARDGDPAYVQVPLDEFRLQRFIPKDCDGCVKSGHLTPLLDWYLARDANVRVGAFSSWYDSVLANTFLQVPPADFADSLKDQSDRLHQAHPDRFRRFIIDGKQHTSLLGDPSGVIGSDLTSVELPPGAVQMLIGGGLAIEGIDKTTLDGVTMADWLAALIDGDTDRWTDSLAKRGPVPE